MINAKSKIRYHYEQACKIAENEVIRMARDILRKHKNLDEFIMAMGGWFFTEHGDVKHDKLCYMKHLDDFITEWDEFLKITGSPMRFTASGKVRRDWR